METYVETLDDDIKKYLNKLRIFYSTDPYAIQAMQWTDDVDACPCITFPDIVLSTILRLAQATTHWMSSSHTKVSNHTTNLLMDESEI